MRVRQVDIRAVLGFARRGNAQHTRLTLRLASEHITLREIITRSVTLEQERCQAGEAVALQQLLEVVLGKGGAFRPPRPQPVSDNDAAELALESFRRGAYRVFVDGHAVTNLDELLSVGMRSSVVFARIVPLVSG